MSAESTQVFALDGSCTLPPEDIGGKAWGINRMRTLRLPVPPAFVVSTHACREHNAHGGGLAEALWVQVVEHMKLLELASARGFGATRCPLLVSVRSGAARSMPGMMDTVLNVGITAAVEKALIEESDDAQFASETRRRFAEQYRKVVLGDQLAAIPPDPWAQLRAAVAAIFDSWHAPRAQVYRRSRGLSDDACTAVTIQMMVFGNIDSRSGTGVLFSRNPITGDAPPWGEWLARSQGEDVVSGRSTPQPLARLCEAMPEVHAELLRATATLEADARDIQDIEFTVESARLWLLQSRVAKRSAQAALRAAVAFAEEGLISKEQALRRLSPEQARQLPALRLAPQAAQLTPLAVGEPASPGVASGVVLVEPAQAEARSGNGEALILARPDTSPEDLRGILAARGLITEQGGATSHAAVVSRELGRPCVVGCGSNSVTRLAGQRVTLDGATGRIWSGDLTLEQSDEAASGDLAKLIEWATPLVSLRLLKPDQARADTIDLDALGTAWRAALRPGVSVRGAVLETDQGIRAALAAGVRCAVVRRRLPALLACLQPAAAAERAAAELAAVTPVEGVDELTLLRLVALKGRATEEILADSLALPTSAAVAALYAPLCDLGLCTCSGGGLRLTATGRERLTRLLQEERSRSDPAAVVALYEDFCVFNTELKQIMTSWQVKPEGAANDHGDPAYDEAVLQRLALLHQRATPLLQGLARLSPRLARYHARLERAAARVAAGEHSYVAKIISDSYHTIWFELHEDLLALAGLSRETVERGEIKWAR